MDKKYDMNLVIAFALGALVTLIVIALRPNEQRYVPFGTSGIQILDTRNGSAYVMGANGKWNEKTKRVGVK